jgi:integrase
LVLLLLGVGLVLGRVWVTARTRAESPAWATPHDLRHYYALVLIRSGASVKVVQTRLGHSSAKTTLDIYGHLFADEEDRTRAAIDAELGVRVIWVSRRWVDDPNPQVSAYRS